MSNNSKKCPFNSSNICKDCKMSIYFTIDDIDIDLNKLKSTETNNSAYENKTNEIIDLYINRKDKKDFYFCYLKYNLIVKLFKKYFMDSIKESANQKLETKLRIESIDKQIQLFLDD